MTIFSKNILMIINIDIFIIILDTALPCISMAKTVTTGCSFTGSQDGRRALHLEKQVTAEMDVCFRKQTITNKFETILTLLTNHCSLPH